MNWCLEGGYCYKHLAMSFSQSPRALICKGKATIKKQMRLYFSILLAWSEPALSCSSLRRDGISPLSNEQQCGEKKQRSLLGQITIPIEPWSRQDMSWDLQLGVTWKETVSLASPTRGSGQVVLILNPAHTAIQRRCSLRG